MCIEEAWVKPEEIEPMLRGAQEDIRFLWNYLERIRALHREEQRRSAERLHDCIERTKNA